MPKSQRKNHVLPKTEVKHISQSFDFMQTFHYGHEDYGDRMVDGGTVSPPAPCTGSKDSSGDSLTTSPVSQVDKHIITEQSDQSRPNMKIVQSLGADCDKRDNSVKLKLPVASRKKVSERQKPFLNEWELETSEV